MDLFENMEKIKENMLQSLDKITDDKKTIYDQIKRLETEQYILKNNLGYFETYLNFLEYKNASSNSISSSENNFQINASDLKFEDFVNMNNSNSSNNNNNNRKKIDPNLPSGSNNHNRNNNSDNHNLDFENNIN